MRSEVPPGWRWSTVQGVVDSNRRVTYGIVQPGPRQEHGGVPIIRGQDYSGGQVDDSDLYRVSDDIAAQYHRSTLQSGDILLSIVGYPGLTAMVPDHLTGANLTQTTARIAIDGSNDRRFFHYQFQGPAFEMEVRKYTKGSAQPGLNLADVDRMRVVVPPLPEQKKIAAILSSVDDAIQATEAVIVQTRRVKEGLLQDLLTKGIGHTRFKQTEIGEIPEEWGVRRLGEILPTSDGIKPGPFGSSLTKSKYVAAGFKVYGQEQVLAGDLSVGSYYITERHYLELRKFAVEAGDLLLTLVGAGTPGKVLVVRRPFEPGLINPRLIRIRPPSSVLSPQFLERVFEAPVTQREILRIGQGGAMPVLSAGLVRSLWVPLPPIKEQAQIVGWLDEWDAGAKTAHEVLNLLVATKSGLLQDLLTGKVRVTV